MKRLIAVVCAGALASAAVASSADAGNATSEQHARNLAAHQCKAERSADPVAFKSVWGKNGLARCIHATAPKAANVLNNAAKQCKAARAADPAGFAQTYGTGKNALGKCISTKAHANEQAAVEAFQNAARDCRAERAADPAGFVTTYGTSTSRGHNAFGKCVSSKVANGGTS